jgi:hypothetical protein
MMKITTEAAVTTLIWNMRLISENLVTAFILHMWFLLAGLGWLTGT